MPQQPGNLSGRCRKTGVCSINLEIPLSYFEKSRGPTGMEKSPSQRARASPGTSSLTAVALPFSGPPSVCLCEKFYSSYTTYTTLQGGEHYLCGMYTRGRHASCQARRGCGRVQSRAMRLAHAERTRLDTTRVRCRSSATDPSAAAAQAARGTRACRPGGAQSLSGGRGQGGGGGEGRRLRRGGRGEEVRRWR